MKRLIIAALVLVGCGTDQKEKGSNGDDSQEVIAEEKKEALENTFTVASLDDLPQCDEETEGRLGYVTHEEMLFSFARASLRTSSASASCTVESLFHTLNKFTESAALATSISARMFG